jgi:rhodanese-related sulfurtransferase
LTSRRRNSSRKGHLPNALNIPGNDLEKLAPVLLPDTTNPVMTYGGSSAAGEAAAGKLVDLGYLTVSGTPAAWVDADLPVATSTCRTARRPRKSTCC